MNQLATTRKVVRRAIEMGRDVLTHSRFALRNIDSHHVALSINRPGPSSRIISNILSVFLVAGYSPAIYT